ncbi:Crossover junction endonuclease eme1b, partial [Thalictrum thalictroides]
MDLSCELAGRVRSSWGICSLSESCEEATELCFEHLWLDVGNLLQRIVMGREGSVFVQTNNEEQNVATERVGNSIEQKYKLVDEEKSNHRDGTKSKKRKTKEEKAHLAEEKKLKREQEKLQKEALKAEAAEAKKLQKEQQMWEKGKFALKSIVAEIDAKVVELGSIGGHLLSMFADKGLSFRITSNPIERSILWTMSVPEQFAELSSSGIEIPYVLLVYEAEEFCNLLSNDSFIGHVLGVQSRYSSYTICYITNKLMAYINK